MKDCQMKEDFKYLVYSRLLVFIIGSALFIGFIIYETIDYETDDKTLQTPPKIESSQKIYTLKLSNGYNTSTAYMMTKDTSSLYIKILNNCPIPLKIHTYEEYEKQYLYKVVKKYSKFNNAQEFASKNVVGQHVRGWAVTGWPNYFLFVKARPNPHELMGTYFHEMGHYKCNTGKCSYCKSHGHKHIRELHAVINGLEEAMRYDLPEVVKSSFNKYEGWLGTWEDYKNHEKYGDAVLTIQSSELWTKIKTYSKEHNISVPIFKKPQAISHKKCSRQNCKRY